MRADGCETPTARYASRAESQIKRRKPTRFGLLMTWGAARPSVMRWTAPPHPSRPAHHPCANPTSPSRRAFGPPQDEVGYADPEQTRPLLRDGPSALLRM